MSQFLIFPHPEPYRLLATAENWDGMLMALRTIHAEERREYFVVVAPGEASARLPLSEADGPAWAGLWRIVAGEPRLRCPLNPSSAAPYLRVAQAAALDDMPAKAPESVPDARGGSQGHRDIPDPNLTPQDALRFLFVTDAATEIPVAVIATQRTRDGASWVLHRAGFPPSTTYALVVDLLTMEANSDPFLWCDATMRAFHLWLVNQEDGGRTGLEMVMGRAHGERVDVTTYRLEMFS